MNTDTTDAQLLAAIHARQDGEAALAAIIARHGTMVLATCRRIIGHHHDAEEAAQAVMLVLHDKAGKGLVVASLPAWLHRVACFVAVRLRDARRRRARREVGWSPAHDAVAAAADDRAEGDLARRIDEALDRLPSHYRLPLLLHYLESCSFDEIAQRLDLRAGTVAVRVSRARAMMRRHLAVPEHAFDLGMAAALTDPAAPTWAGMAATPPKIAALAHGYLRAHTVMTIMKVMAASVAAGLALCVTIACASGNRRDVAVPPNPPAAPAVVGTTPVYPRAEFFGPWWQERLAAELSRPVTLHSPAQPVWRLIDAIGQQADIVMLADGSLRGNQTTIPPLDVDGGTVQALLDRIAASAGLDYQMYAGGLIWQTANPIPDRPVVVPGTQPMSPNIIRIYHLADLPPGRDVPMWVDALRRQQDLDFNHDGYGSEQIGDLLIISYRADGEPALDAVLQPAAKPMTGPSASVPDDLVPAAGAAEQALQRAMEHPSGPLPASPARLDDLLTVLAHDAGIDVQMQGDLPAFRQTLPERPLPLRLVGLPLRFALCQVLEGTGVQAAFHLDGSGAAQRPLLVVGAAVATQLATHHYQWRPQPRPGITSQAWDSGNCAEWLSKTVDVETWTAKWVKIETDAEAPLQVTQSLEVLRDIDEQMPRLWTLANGYPVIHRVPILPALHILAPNG